MEERSVRLHVAKRRTRVTKGTPAAAAAAEEVADHDDDLPDPLDNNISTKRTMWGFKVSFTRTVTSVNTR